MSAPQTVLDLVARFGQQVEAYKTGSYNETQVRRDFLDPLFRALDWDMDNVAGYAEAYRDVIHEDAIRIGGAVKAPDYCFRIGGTRKFFLEAKRPSVDIKTDVSSAYQVRRYAWSAKLPLSILSDFEELAIYDCRIKPSKDDPASRARIFYCSFREYDEKWEWLASTFSRNAILKGSFDKFAEANRAKRGTAEVDADFLDSMESWRNELAKNLALRNEGLTQRELNFAVQRILDRIIFLRICEDRGLEDYGRLRSLANGAKVYSRLCTSFQEADTRYNSGLFHFKAEKGRHEPPDDLTLRLTIDDGLLKDLFQGLYYPDSPYEFSVLSADILGQVYEQFLGKIIRLTDGHRAVVEEKPEVRKAGGVYYTPKYVADYIVQETLGKLVIAAEGSKYIRDEGQSSVPQVRPSSEKDGLTSLAQKGGDRTPLSSKVADRILEKISKIRVLDPACGSGSFLICAYQYLLDWHLRFFTNNDAERWARKKKPPIVETNRGWRLTTAERKRILLANIFGVDIDAQSVEVTKLSLLLKVLEGETSQSIAPLFSIFHERALPDLGDNIKCGNSLVSGDYYQQPSLPLLSSDDEMRVNPFDWWSETGFPEIHRAGGFDAVIGNPPYVRQESLSELKSYFESHYQSFNGTADLYTYFIEQSLKLLRNGGLFSFIVSSSFLRTSSGEPLRRVMKSVAAIRKIVDFGGIAVFAKAKDTYVCIPLLEKAGVQTSVEIGKVRSLAFASLAGHVEQHSFTIPSDRLTADAWPLRSDEESAVIETVMAAGPPLGEYLGGRIYYGIKTGLNEAFVIDSATRDRLIKMDSNSVDLVKPLLGGEDIRRYVYNETGLWLIFARRGVNIDDYPAIRDHLSKWREDLTPKKDKKTKRGRKPGRYAWYEIQDDVAYYEVFDGPKLIYPDIAKGPRFCLDVGGHYVANTGYCLGTDDRYLLGLLNSKLIWFAISNISIPFGTRAGKFRYRLIHQYMERVPIRVLNRANPGERAIYSRIITLVTEIMSLIADKKSSRTPHDRTLMERQVAARDEQLDRLIYQIYGLKDREIALVEDSLLAVTANSQVEEEATD